MTKRCPAPHVVDPRDTLDLESHLGGQHLIAWVDLLPEWIGVYSHGSITLSDKMFAIGCIEMFTQMLGYRYARPSADTLDCGCVLLHWVWSDENAGRTEHRTGRGRYGRPEWVGRTEEMLAAFAQRGYSVTRPMP